MDKMKQAVFKDFLSGCCSADEAQHMSVQQLLQHARLAEGGSCLSSAAARGLLS